jgi:hypothetical protein
MIQLAALATKTGWSSTGPKRRSSRGSVAQADGSEIGCCRGKRQTRMAANIRNVLSRRQWSLGWCAKTGPVAGPIESLMATRTGGFFRGATSWMMASGAGLGPTDGVARWTLDPEPRLPGKPSAAWLAGSLLWGVNVVTKRWNGAADNGFSRNKAIRRRAGYRCRSPSRVV